MAHTLGQRNGEGIMETGEEFIDYWNSWVTQQERSVIEDKLKALKRRENPDEMTLDGITVLERFLQIESK